MNLNKNISTLAMSGLSLAVFAQPAIQQIDDSRREWEQQRALMSTDTKLAVPENYPGETADVGEQHVLKVKPRRSLFEVDLDSEYFHTDNTFLSKNNPKETAILVNTIQIAYAPPPFNVRGGQLALNIGFRSQWYNYGLDGRSDGLDLGKFDFNAQTAFADAQYLFGNNWIAHAGLDYTRLLDQDRYDEFYTDYVPKAGISRRFAVNERLLITAGLEEAYHFSWVQPLPRSDINDRLDSTLSLSASYALTPQVALQPYYRFTHTYYQQTAFGTGRNDLLNTIGLAVPYYITKQIAVRLFTSADFRVSDDSHVADYTKVDVGLGASLIVRF